jgi:hypothetical protein
MPFHHTCRDHDEWTGDCVEDAIRHVGAKHPGLSTGTALADGGPISVRFVTQLAAHDKPTLRMYLCATCYERVETTDDTLADRCEAHRRVMA